MSTSSRDVVIVGGGVVGSATAYYLARAGAITGRRVIIVEKDARAGRICEAHASKAALEADVARLQAVRARRGSGRRQRYVAQGCVHGRARAARWRRG